MDVLSRAIQVGACRVCFTELLVTPFERRSLPTGQKIIVDYFAWYLTAPDSNAPNASGSDLKVFAASHGSFKYREKDEVRPTTDLCTDFRVA